MLLCNIHLVLPEGRSLMQDLQEYLPGLMQVTCKCIHKQFCTSDTGMGQKQEQICFSLRHPACSQEGCITDLGFPFLPTLWSSLWSSLPRTEVLLKQKEKPGRSTRTAKGRFITNTSTHYLLCCLSWAFVFLSGCIMWTWTPVLQTHNHVVTLIPR